ncbi:hypothetical protein LTR36_003993 [Oleoguttula mirabilis]|uniref:Putative zinc-finger domain-containing protein n=1 Tax=Oleoguttula mirabilis TaxID=1507867 RepID=A0AAV9JI12_9PEZI|nr:hypothetical protein LTR36_003993 [Oleoguttula mirabilis]
MAQNIPFLFGAGGGPPAPPAPPQPQQQMTSNAQQQTNGVAPQAQQAAFLQNALLPGMDMSALNGISPAQLALIGQLFQSGALNLPQVPIAPQPPAPTTAAAIVLPSATQAHSEEVTAPSYQEDVEMDKEDGELEEGEELDASREREFLRPPPTGPRKRSASPGDQYGSADRRASFQDPRISENPAKARKVSEQRSNEQAGKQGASPSMSRRTTTNGQSNGRRMIDAGSAARKFVLQMHNAGYSFEQLAKEVPNHTALRSMYKALNLPLPPASAAPHVAQMDGTVPSPLQQPRPNGTAASHTYSAAVGDRKVSATSKPAPAKPALPANREEYLARLAKLKTKPTASGVTPPTPKPAEQPKPLPTNAVTEPEPAVLLTAPTPNSKPAAFKSTVKTDLLKERLAKLKAEQAAKMAAASSSSDAPAVSSPLARPAPTTASSIPQPAGVAAYNGLGAGLGESVAKSFSSTQLPATGLTTTVPAQAPQQHIPTPLQTSFSSAPPTPNRPASALPGLFRLPGLFMGGTPTQASPIMQQPQRHIPPPPPPPPAPKPVLSAVLPGQPKTAFVNHDVSAASPVPSPAPLTIARRRPVAADFDNDVPASTVPSVSKRPVFGQSRSNSESERLIIEVSEDEDDIDDEPTPVASASKASFGYGKLSNFPPKPSFSSAPGTPGGVTPLSAAEHAERMKAHDVELDRIRRRLAEQEAKKLAKSKGAVDQQGVPTPASGKSTPMPQAVAEIVPATLAINVPTTTRQSLSAAALARQHERASLMVRQQELTEQLSRASSASVAPSSASGEAIVPVALTGGNPIIAKPAPIEAKSNVQAVDSEADTAPNGEQMEVSSDEEGELSDDAADLPEQTGNGAAAVSVPYDDDKIGSQASTVGTSQPGLEDAAVAHASNTLPMAVDEVTPVAATESRPESVRDNGNGVDEPMDEESSEEDDVDDLDDLDAPNPQTDKVANGDEGLLGDDSTSASSTPASDDDEEDYEPKLINPFANGNGEADAAIPDVNDAEPVVTQRRVDGDLAPELQPSKEQQTAIADHQEPPPQTSYFKPYESALSRFHDYRYHPDYLSNVRGGFKSLTYSHKIDSTKTLCQFEAAGGKCNNKQCEHQHFQNMTITDTNLLQELGTSRMPANGPAEEKRWKEGLGNVVKQLRSTSIGKDANAIAARIAEYRRDFLGDPTKTLNLG